MKLKILVFSVMMLVLMVPSTSYAKFGLKLGYFTPSEANSYGQGYWDFYDESGGPKDGWPFLELYGSIRRDSGLGFDFGTRSPMSMKTSAEGSIMGAWFEEEYTKFVWPIFHFSTRYHVQSNNSPYFGGGLSFYYVDSKYTYEDSFGYDEEETNSELVPGINIFAGIEFFHKRKTHMDLEVRYEWTIDHNSTWDDACDYDDDFCDDGNLGGLMFSLGVSW